MRQQGGFAVDHTRKLHRFPMDDVLRSSEIIDGNETIRSKKF
jgi:hypothetical protein